MKLEELLECSADKLEALDDAQLEALLKPYFPLTRPELQVNRTERKPVQQKLMSPEEMAKAAKRKRAEALIAQFGIKLNK